MDGNEPTDPAGRDDDRALQELAAAILDGKPIDWAAVSATLPADVVEELRALAAVTNLHRGLPDAASPRADSAPAGVGLGTWGHLRLAERIAAGSFGEVFRAWDTRLDREVALKLLYPGGPQAHGAPAVIAEGRLLARIRHPNVVVVFGAERIDGRVGIWTEFIDGITLSALVQRDGPLSVERAAAIGADLCRALAAVHEAGLVHGDVKAQNVLQESGGRVVLVDLGTGREHAPGAAHAHGPISGTPLYMAPELWRGAHPTVSSDLYSAGVLLHYLVSGTFPVVGATAEDVRAAHERGERTTLSAARPDLPARFSAIVDRATSASPALRPESARSMEAELEGHRRAPARRRRLAQIAAVLAAVAAVGALTAYALRLPRRYPAEGAPSEISRAAVRTRQITFHSPEVTIATTAVSADGDLLAYKASTGLFVTSLSGDAAARRLDWPSDRDVTDLAWLLDGGLLVAGRDGIWRVDVSGAPAVRLADGAQTVNVSPDGTRLALHRGPQGIWLATVEGERIGEVTPPRDQTRFGEPAWSPDGGRLAYPAYTQTPEGLRVTIETRRADGSALTTVFEGGLYGGTGVHNVRWHPDGRVLFSRPFRPPRGRFTNWWQLRVDATTGESVGEPKPITDWPDFNFGSPSMTADGRVVVAVRTRSEMSLYWGDLDEQVSAVGNLRRLTLDTIDANPSAWTPSGESVLFWSLTKIFEQRTDGSPAREIVAREGGEAVHADYSPDGQFLLYIFEEFPKPDAVMRRPVGGGADEKLFDLAAASSWLRCTGAPVDVCLASEVVDNRLRLVAFDPATGATGPRIELPRPPASRNGWDLSPDGTAIVSLEVGEGAGRLLVTDRSTGATRHVASDALAQAQTIAWHPQGRGWIVTTSSPAGHSVLYVDRSGQSKGLWSSSYQRLWNPTIAPDGRAVVLASGISETNVWLVEGL